ncbi:MAG TPA: alpha/beta fold hydrolase [Acidobacteriaceae bacterium]|jgi:hypothetical protein|nr:alpha/beta fold hydrolase [Acidobacteriaceae bacterium]
MNGREESTAKSIGTRVSPAAAEWRPQDEFVPRRFLSNGHAQTLVGNFSRRQCPLPQAEAHVIEVDPGRQAAGSSAAESASHVLCHCHWQPAPQTRLTLLLVHGLEGSSASQYMLGNGARAWAAGCNVVRMNMRNCGGTEHLSPTLYHSGLSRDVHAVIRTLSAEKGLQAFALVGYSMGGNLVLKLAGEMGEDASQCLRAVVGVSPVIDLGISADALHLPQNRAYEWKFMRGLMARFRRKAQLFPERYSVAGTETIRSIREFDDRITARYSGFLGADDYYYRVASARVVGRISVPTLILHALDDPFIRILPATRADLRANPHVHLLETAHGGHCAFLASRNGYDGYWAEKTLLDFVLAMGPAA